MTLSDPTADETRTDTPAVPKADEPFVLPPPEPPDAGAKGLGTLARTMRRRTSDLIAIGILIVGGIAFANRLSALNGETSSAVVAPTKSAEVPWNEPGRPVSFEFGNADFVLHREIVEGPVELAMQRLVARTAELTDRAPVPTTPPDEAERRLIAGAEQLAATREGDEGDWSVHVSLLPMPTAIGLRSSAETTPLEDGVVVASRRAVCWGLLLGGQDRWTAFWFERRTGGGSTGNSLVVVPSGADRTVTILDAKGLGIAGFHGRADAATWRAHFDRAYTDRNGRRTSGEWARWGNVWTARYAFDDGRTVEVRIAEVRIADENGSLDGLLTIESPNEK